MPGVTSAGFEVKPFDEIKEEYEASFRSLSGSDEFRVPSTSPVGQIVGIQTKQNYDGWQAANDVYLSRWPQTASGRSLDHSVFVGGLERKFGFRTSGVVYLSGSVSTVVPSGTLISTNTDITFETSNGVVLATGAKPVIRIEKQPGNLATSFNIVVSGGLGGLFSSIANREQTISFTANSAEVIAAINTLFDESDIVETAVISSTDGITITFREGRFLPDFLVTDGTLNVVSEGLPDGAAVGVTAIEAGPSVVSSFQVVNINSPINGLNSVINLEAFITGRETETDQELRGRWQERTQSPITSSARAIRNEIKNLSGVSEAVVFEARSLIEVVVVGGGDREIAETLYETKPPGTMLQGTTSFTVTDVNGNPKPVFFSRPTIRPFYVRVAITKGTDFPGDGEEQVKGALLNYLNSFRIGGSLRPTPDMVWALQGISGINDLEITVSEDNQTFSNDPIQLSNREKPSFETITVTIT